jgi:hypothetical protein
MLFSPDECRLQSEESNKTLNSFRKLAILAHRIHVKKNHLKISAKQSMMKALLNEKYCLALIGNL